MRVPWLSLALFTLVSVLFSVYRLEAGTSTFTATPGAGATLRETTDASGFFLPNTTIWDSAAGANGLTINADHTMDIEGIVSNAGSAIATGSLNLGTNAYNYGFNGTTWDQLQVDGSKSLKVNCITGCAGGALSNATSGIATTSTNLGTIGYGYAFNGTTWDQLQDDGSKNLKVNLSAATLASLPVTESGTWTINVKGNAGGAMDAAGYNAALPANEMLMGAEFLTSPGAITSGNISPLQMDSTGHLLVNCTGCSAASDVGGFHSLLTQTPTVTASAYASGNDMGGLLTFAAFRNTTQTSGKVDNIMIAFKGGAVGTSYTLYVFATTPGTTCTDKTAFALATADVSKLAAVAPIVMTPQVFGTGSVESFASVSPAITIANLASVQNIFMCLVANGAVTPASTTDLVVTVATSQD